MLGKLTIFSHPPLKVLIAFLFNILIVTVMFTRSTCFTHKKVIAYERKRLTGCHKKLLPHVRKNFFSTHHSLVADNLPLHALEEGKHTLQSVPNVGHHVAPFVMMNDCGFFALVQACTFVTQGRPVPSVTFVVPIYRFWLLWDET